MWNTKSLPPPDPPLLNGKRVLLRPIGDDDYAFLYGLGTDVELAYRWRFRGETPSPEAFHSLLWNGTLVQFMVCARDTGSPVGHIFAYNANFRYQTAFIGVAVKTSCVGRGWTLEAANLFLRYVFALWPFRKLYAEVLEFNYGQFASASGRGFEVEGRFREHEFYGDRYWDLLILAIYRETVLGKPSGG